MDPLFDHPEEPHGGTLCLGLLRKGFQFPHLLPVYKTLASQGCSSHTGGHQSTSAVSPVTHWGLPRGGGSVWQCIQPSSINHVLNTCRLLVSYSCLTRGCSWSSGRLLVKAVLGAHFQDKPNSAPNLVVQTLFVCRLTPTDG